MLEFNSDKNLYEAIVNGRHFEVDPDIFAETEQERRNTYLEQGMSKTEAEQKAWDETREVWQWEGCTGVTIDGVEQG